MFLANLCNTSSVIYSLQSGEFSRSSLRSLTEIDTKKLSGSDVSIQNNDKVVCQDSNSGPVCETDGLNNVQIRKNDAVSIDFSDDVKVSKDLNQTVSKAVKCKVAYDSVFGQILLCISANRLQEEGFEYGDSVNVCFSNGFELLDIPYSRTYSTRTGAPLIVNYHGTSCPAICRNNWDSL